MKQEQKAKDDKQGGTADVTAVSSCQRDSLRPKLCGYGSIEGIPIEDGVEMGR